MSVFSMNFEELRHNRSAKKYLEEIHKILISIIITVIITNYLIISKIKLLEDRPDIKQFCESLDRNSKKANINS